MERSSKSSQVSTSTQEQQDEVQLGVETKSRDFTHAASSETAEVESHAMNEHDAGVNIELYNARGWRCCELAEMEIGQTPRLCFRTGSFLTALQVNEDIGRRLSFVLSARGASCPVVADAGCFYFLAEPVSVEPSGDFFSEVDARYRGNGELIPAPALHRPASTEAIWYIHPEQTEWQPGDMYLASIALVHTLSS